MNKRAFTDRRLHLVDIENLVGTPRPSSREVALVKSVYEGLGLCLDSDLVVVACNHGAAASVVEGWAGARYLLRSGENGADYALLDVLANESIEARFREVVIASGDGIFAEAVARLEASGVIRFSDCKDGVVVQLLDDGSARGSTGDAT